jgi:4-hydroxythreonine-4-phosphate dehydrogenase
MAPIIGISIGDMNGIGPEITLKAVSQFDTEHSTPLILSPEKVIRFYAELLSLDIPLHYCESSDQIIPNQINVLDLEIDHPELTPGIQSEDSGRVAMKSIEKAIELCMDTSISAMVTAPISKEAVNLAGYSIPGHTEFLAEKTHADHVLMMLVNKGLRVALNTVHIPISQVAASIRKESIKQNLRTLYDSLKNDFNIESPKIAVLGLNPHAGDGGVIGTEEIEIISPAIKEAVSERITALGPYPADGFFGQKLHSKFDAILAMYHDQGLAPFKLLSFGSGVNFSAGLPIIRTSPDHGTAFDIAGKGLADPSSFIQAYELAIELSNKRHAG